MATHARSRSGWVTLAGVVALVAGLYNGLSGLSTITSDYGRIEQAQELLFGIDVDAWAWFGLLVGILQLLAGVLLLMRNLFGYVLGIWIAAFSAMTAVFGIFEWPLWAFSVLTLDIL